MTAFKLSLCWRRAEMSPDLAGKLLAVGGSEVRLYWAQLPFSALIVRVGLDRNDTRWAVSISVGASNDATATPAARAVSLAELLAVVSYFCEGWENVTLAPVWHADPWIVIVEGNPPDGYQAPEAPE